MRIALAVFLVLLTFNVAADAQYGAQVFGGGKAYPIVTAASNNSQMIGAAGPHKVLAVVPLNDSATEMYVRLYDTATAPTCSSATGAIAMFPVFEKAAGGGMVNPLPAQGVTVVNGLGVCITGAFGLTDNTNAATGMAVTFVIL